MSDRPIVLITGASKGIGAETAKLFAKNGYNICINYMSDEEGANAVANSCKKLGAQAIACLLYTSPSPRDKRQSRMPSSA